MKLLMTDNTGERFTWTVSERRKYSQGPRHHFQGYSFTDHEGYERIVEGNWKNLVSDLQYTANNYGLSCILS